MPRLPCSPILLLFQESKSLLEQFHLSCLAGFWFGNIFLLRAFFLRQDRPSVSLKSITTSLGLRTLLSMIIKLRILVPRIQIKIRRLLLAVRSAARTLGGSMTSSPAIVTGFLVRCRVLLFAFTPFLFLILGTIRGDMALLLASKQVRSFTSFLVLPDLKSARSGRGCTRNRLYHH